MSGKLWGRLRPRVSDYSYPGARPRADAIAGVTVAIVALPLALAFGVTSGLGARAGVVTAIVAGVVAGIFGGSDVQVSGPTGAMTVVLVPIVARYGASAVLAVGLIAGVVLVAAASAGLGRYVSYIPWPVVEGFTVGIAIIIFLQQVPAFLGVQKPKGENAFVVATRAIMHGGQLNRAALAVAVIVAMLMLLVPRIGRALPVSLIAVVAGTVVSQVMHMHIARIGVIPSALPMPRFPDLRIVDPRALVGPAFAVAALAAIESLLSARVADGMADGREHDPDRELLGQGLANVVSPLFGGMPATGAIARTAVNVRAGARSRVAAMSHGVLLAFAVLFLGRTIRVVPLAALAGVLMVTAVHMVDLKAVKMLLRSTRSDAVVLLLTTLTTVIFDLVVAIVVGLVVASGLALRNVARATSFEAEWVPADGINVADEEGLLHEHIVAYRLDGALFFGAAQRFLSELATVADVRVVVLRLSRLQMLDATGAQALGDITLELESRGVTVLLAGARPQHRRLMMAVGALRGLAHEEHIVDTLDEAIAHARVHAQREQHVTTAVGRQGLEPRPPD